MSLRDMIYFLRALSVRPLFFCISATLYLVSVTGCGNEDFDPKSLLQSYRVIGIKAEPPEIQITEQTTLTVIDFHPNDLTDEARPEIKYEWKICPLTIGSLVQYECFVDDILLMEQSEELLINPLMILGALGEDFETQLGGSSESLSPEMSDIDLGILEVYVKLKVTSKGTPPINVVKKIGIHLKPSGPKNQNPQLQAIRRLPEQELYITEEEIDLEAIAEEGAAEEYLPRSDQTALFEASMNMEMNTESEETNTAARSQTTPQREELIFTWFTTGGKLKRSVVLEKDPTNIFTLPEESGKHRLYLTVRDGRGGIDVKWVDFEVIEKE